MPAMTNDQITAILATLDDERLEGGNLVKLDGLQQRVLAAAAISTDGEIDEMRLRALALDISEIDGEAQAPRR